MSVRFAYIHVDITAPKGWPSGAARMRELQPTIATRS